jgi:hypothetical protein
VSGPTGGGRRVEESREGVVGAEAVPPERIVRPACLERKGIGGLARARRL